MLKKNAAVTTPLIYFLIIVGLILGTILFYFLFKFAGHSYNSNQAEDVILTTSVDPAMNSFLSRELVVEKDGTNHILSVSELISLSISNPDWEDLAKSSVEEYAKSHFLKAAGDIFYDEKYQMVLSRGIEVFYKDKLQYKIKIGPSTLGASYSEDELWENTGSNGKLYPNLPKLSTKSAYDLYKMYIIPVSDGSTIQLKYYYLIR